MNNIKIKVNGVAISLENSPVINDTSLEDMSALLSKESDDIEKMIKATTLLSNIKTVESFGYKSTESVGENIKKAAIAVKNKLVEWFKSLAEFFRNLLAKSAISSDKTNLKNDFKPLVDKIHTESTASIKKLTSPDVSPEEIEKLKGKQKVYNIVRQAAMRIVALCNFRAFNYDTLKKYTNVALLMRLTFV